MGWLLDNMKALEDFENNANTRTRQQKEDEYRDEVRARERKQLAAAEQAKNDFQNTAKEYDFNGDGEDVQKVLGVQPAAPEVPSTFKPAQDSMAANVAPVQPAQSAPKKPSALDQQMGLIASKAKYLRSIGDVNGFYAAADMFNKAKMQKTTASIADYVQNAPDAELQNLMKQVSVDSKNKYQANFDPVSGFSTIALGDTKATLNKNELSQYLSAKYRLSQGDMTALGDMAAVDKGLAAQVAAELGITQHLVTTNNDAAYKKATIANNAEKLAMQGDLNAQKMALAQARLAGGGGRSGGGPSGQGVDPSQGFDRAKMYAKNLERWQKIADGDVATPGSQLTPAQISQNALKDTDAAQSAWVDSSKASNQAGIIHQLMKPSRNTAMSPDSQEYADLYLGVSQAKGQAIPREYMDSLGYPYPGLWAGRNRVATPKTK